MCDRGSGRSKTCMWPPIVVALILAAGADKRGKSWAQPVMLL